MTLKTFFRLVILSSALTTLVRAQTAPFDLAGPEVDVRVERAGKTLPISAVPNLLAGDRIWIHPDLPDTQSARYLLVVAFLRGATNPPPENWFTRAETWNKKIRDEGIFVVVPPEAEQALIFLAPETGGDYSTLRNAVRARPGAFVRASQDLNVASLDRKRLETYLQAIREAVLKEPDQLEARSKLLARSLNIKVDPTCFDKPANEQATCLTAHTDQMVLTDAHSQSMVSTVTSGATADLMTQLTATPTAGAGYFSPYVGAIIDIARILDNLHTAEFQYIPALSLPQRDTLNLKLNNPPSFKNPKSVIVIALPPVEGPQIPPLRAVNPKQTYCVEKPESVLNVEGAPLVFATDYAHDLSIHIPEKSGKETIVPITADPKLGGFVLDPKALSDNKLDQEAVGYMRGMWGFQPFDGPSFRLASARPEQWHVGPSDESALITGRTDTLHLHADSSSCVSNVTVKDEKGEKIAAAWNMNAPDDLEVQPALQNTPPGKITVAVTQFGDSTPDELHLQAYSEAGHLSNFTLYAGDQQGVLRGTRLDQVAGLDLNGTRFAPGALSRAEEEDQLQMSLMPQTKPEMPQTKPDFQPSQKIVAKVMLKDGRTLPLPITVATPRPQVTVISKSIQPASGLQPPLLQNSNTPQLQIHLTAADELSLDGQLSFSLKAVVPDHFPRTESIEVASEDESLRFTLSLANGRLVLEDAKTIVATLDPEKDLGSSAFGPLKFRPIDADGAAGDWQPLAQLVRLPVLSQLKCAKTPDRQCTLTGSNLFLIDAIASDPNFANSVTVPEGYADLTLTVPHPDASRTLYLKLRDDPQAVNTAQVAGPALDVSQQSAAVPAPAATVGTNH
ncbi:hypothetical protein ACPOL_6660 [Acidisarcina polymorpha]|uniref:Uncharacterized protein n=1 Tax=Acidisarcina polymorpha TaxID=2211140 RepID=A0A2Z5G9A9_9BACT|nr:hypothetical protein [Acidisarcina polymorpha]AXC15872.1 hypothetical protein ACPOL_6660 [Acidisarcina polymorpha]